MIRNLCQIKHKSKKHFLISRHLQIYMIIISPPQIYIQIIFLGNRKGQTYVHLHIERGIQGRTILGKWQILNPKISKTKIESRSRRDLGSLFFLRRCGCGYGDGDGGRRSFQLSCIILLALMSVEFQQVVHLCHFFPRTEGPCGVIGPIITIIAIDCWSSSSIKVREICLTSL